MSVFATSVIVYELAEPGAVAVATSFQLSLAVGLLDADGRCASALIISIGSLFPHKSKALNWTFSITGCACFVVVLCTVAGVCLPGDAFPTCSLACVAKYARISLAARASICLRRSSSWSLGQSNAYDCGSGPATSEIAGTSSAAF